MFDPVVADRQRTLFTLSAFFMSREDETGTKDPRVSEVSCSEWKSYCCGLPRTSSSAVFSLLYVWSHRLRQHEEARALWSFVQPQYCIQMGVFCCCLLLFIFFLSLYNNIHVYLHVLYINTF